MKVISVGSRKNHETLCILVCPDELAEDLRNNCSRGSANSVSFRGTVAVATEGDTTYFTFTADKDADLMWIKRIDLVGTISCEGPAITATATRTRGLPTAYISGYLIGRDGANVVLDRRAKTTWLSCDKGWSEYLPTLKPHTVF